MRENEPPFQQVRPKKRAGRNSKGKKGEIDGENETTTRSIGGVGLYGNTKGPRRGRGLPHNSLGGGKKRISETKWESRVADKRPRGIFNLTGKEKKKKRKGSNWCLNRRGKGRT